MARIRRFFCPIYLFEIKMIPCFVCSSSPADKVGIGVLCFIFCRGQSSLTCLFVRYAGAVIRSSMCCPLVPLIRGIQGVLRCFF